MEETPGVLIDEEFDVDLSEFADTPDEETGNQAEEPAEEVQQQEEGPEPSTEQQTQEGAGTENTENQPGDDGFEVNFLGETKKVTREEAIPWIQKGMDHDRVAEQRDALRQQLEEQQQWRAEQETLLSQIQTIADATSEGDVNRMLANLRVSILTGQTGMSREAAEYAVRNQDLQRQMAASQERQRAEHSQQLQQQAQKARNDREFFQFVQKFPGVSMQQLPKEVWAAYNAGVPLTAAYAPYAQAASQAKELESMRAEIAQLKQNDKNRQRSVGSVQSAGQETDGRGDFERGFDAAW